MLSEWVDMNVLEKKTKALRVRASLYVYQSATTTELPCQGQLQSNGESSLLSHKRPHKAARRLHYLRTPRCCPQSSIRSTSAYGSFESPCMCSNNLAPLSELLEIVLVKIQYHPQGSLHDACSYTCIRTCTFFRGCIASPSPGCL